MGARLFLFASILGLTTLSGCATTPTSESECRAKGGEWLAYSMFVRVCAWPAADAGKACSDSRECEGICEIPPEAYRTISSRPEESLPDAPVSERVWLIPKPDSAIVGRCSALRTQIKAPNCTAYVADGKVAVAGCID